MGRLDKVAASVRKRLSLPSKKKRQDKENVSPVSPQAERSEFMYWATLGCDRGEDAEQLLLATIHEAAGQLAPPPQVKAPVVLPPSAALLSSSQSIVFVAVSRPSLPTTNSAPSLLSTAPFSATVAENVWEKVQPEMIALPDGDEGLEVAPETVPLPDGEDEDLFAPELIPLPEDGDDDLTEVEAKTETTVIVALKFLRESVSLPEDDAGDLLDVDILVSDATVTETEQVPLPEDDDTDVLELGSANEDQTPAGAFIAGEDVPRTDLPEPSYESDQPSPLQIAEAFKPAQLTAHDFDFESRLGTGGQATVWRARHKKTNMPVAIKVVDKAREGGRMERFVIREQENMRTLAGKPGIANLLATFHSCTRFYLVMPIYAGGDLLDVVARWYSAGFTVPEVMIRHYGAQLILAIETMQRREIYHRDIKPDNVFLDRDHQLFVADFGASITQDEYMDILDRVDPDEQEFVGTLEYMAPEVRVGAEHTFASAVYEFGAVMFFLATGRAPYEAEELMRLIRRQMAGEDVNFGTILDLLGQDEEFISDELLDVLEQTLVPVRQRISLAGLKKLPFFAGMHWKAFDRDTVPSPIDPMCMPPIPTEDEDDLEGHDMTNLEDDERYSTSDDPHPDFYYVADEFRSIVDALAPEPQVSDLSVPAIVLDLADDLPAVSSADVEVLMYGPRFVDRPFKMAGPFVLDVAVPELACLEPAGITAMIASDNEHGLDIADCATEDPDFIIGHATNVHTWDAGEGPPPTGGVLATNPPASSNALSDLGFGDSVPLGELSSIGDFVLGSSENSALLLLVEPPPELEMGSLEGFCETAGSAAPCSDGQLFFDDVMDGWASSVDTTPTGTPEPEYRPIATMNSADIFKQRDLWIITEESISATALSSARNSPALSTKSDEDSFASDVEQTSPTLVSSPASPDLAVVACSLPSSICSSESKDGDAKQILVEADGLHAFLRGLDMLDATEYTKIPSPTPTKALRRIFPRMKTWVQNRLRLSSRQYSS